jgi:hypothetical protein
LTKATRERPAVLLCTHCDYKCSDQRNLAAHLVFHDEEVQAEGDAVDVNFAAEKAADGGAEHTDTEVAAAVEVGEAEVHAGAPLEVEQVGCAESAVATAPVDSARAEAVQASVDSLDAKRAADAERAAEVERLKAEHQSTRRAFGVVMGKPFACAHCA